MGTTKSIDPLILIELNEINFDVVELYAKKSPSHFPALSRLMSMSAVRTSAEMAYEELEPWIQWPSVHTGLQYAEHRIFRLGDIVESDATQVFESIESAGFGVGSISAMNARNSLINAAYFIPDPWTHTAPDKSFWSKTISEALSQAVNDNAQSKITPKTAIQLAAAILRFARPVNYFEYLRYAVGSIRKSWYKALFLDLFLHDVHWRMFRGKGAQFTALFLNAGAHIQHHYFFNSLPLRDQITAKNPSWYVDEADDPVADVLSLYDRIIGQLLNLNGVELLVATGLSQRPYDRTKFYYRLNDHAAFLSELGIRFSSVQPRMTRDFLVEFDDADAATEALGKLSSISISGGDEQLFEDIDNRGKSLFVTLTYPYEITESTRYRYMGKESHLKPLVSFVAIKNGMHQSDGFAFFSGKVAQHAPTDGAHVASLATTILSYFGVKSKSETTATQNGDKSVGCI